MNVIKSYANYLEIQLNYSVNTAEAYERDLNQFAGFVGEKNGEVDFCAVSREDVKCWVEKLMEVDGVAARSVSRKISSLRGLYRYLILNGHDVLDPTEGLILPKFKKRLPEFITEDKMEQAMDRELFDDGFRGDRDRLIIQILYMTGMRVSELVGLKRGDVDVYNATLRVMGKRRKERLIPMGGALIRDVGNYICELEKTFGKDGFADELIVNDKGRKVNRSYIYGIVHGHLNKVSTKKKLSPHVLRHTFATHLLDNGGDINAIKELLGHTSLDATQVYTHNSIKKLKNVYNQAHPRAY